MFMVLSFWIVNLVVADVSVTLEYGVLWVPCNILVPELTTTLMFSGVGMIYFTNEYNMFLEIFCYMLLLYHHTFVVFKTTFFSAILFGIV